MSTIAAFVLGLLIGWLVEWAIDWVYWRPRTQAIEEAEIRCNQMVVALDRELVALKKTHAQLNEESLRRQDELEAAQQEAMRWQNELQATQQETLSLRQKTVEFDPEKSRLEEQVRRLELELSELRARQAEPAVVIPDDLKVIKGVGPVIARKLNQAGVYTFEQLAEQTPLSLRSILGEMIERLSNEESLIVQARQLAERKASQAGKEP